MGQRIESGIDRLARGRGEISTLAGIRRGLPAVAAAAPGRGGGSIRSGSYRSNSRESVVADRSSRNPMARLEGGAVIASVRSSTSSNRSALAGAVRSGGGRRGRARRPASGAECGTTGPAVASEFRTRRRRGHLARIVVGNDAPDGGENFLHRRFCCLCWLSHAASPLKPSDSRPLFVVQRESASRYR